MKRIVDRYLRDWKQRPDRKALMLRGARQVGKTYAVRAFGKTYYDEFAEINLELNPECARVFKANLDPQRILRELRLMTGKRLLPGQSLLFIDEIQQEPLAVSEAIWDRHLLNKSMNRAPCGIFSLRGMSNAGSGLQRSIRHISA